VFRLGICLIPRVHEIMEASKDGGRFMNGCCPGDEFGQDDSSGGGSWLSSLFSSDTPAPDASTDTSAPEAGVSTAIPPLVAAPSSFDPGDPNQLLSKYFTLAQLTVTSLPNPNLPVDQTSFNNLKQTASLLDAIQDNVGPFTIASCYRSPENQLALSSGAQGAASAAMAAHAKKSYHVQGLACDLTPANGMTPTQFAQACYQNPSVAALMGQCVDKSEGGQTSLHVSVQTSQFPTCTPMYVGPDGQYYRMSPTQISAWIAQSSSSPDTLDSNIAVSDDQDTEDDVGDVTSPPWGLIGAGVAAALGAGYWFWWRKRRAR
jgi:hypothetical protein